MEYTEAEILEAQRLVAQLYVGLYGRAPDPDGLDYWTGKLLSGQMTYEQINANLASEQSEWFDLKDGLTNEQLVTELYQQLFERGPDLAGLDYWVNKLDSGSISIDQIAMALINGADATDRAVLDYKIEAALYYTENFETSYGREWMDPEDRGSAQAAVDGVFDRETTDASKAAVDAAANEFGTTWDLEVGADQVNGSLAGDLIQGTLGDGFDDPTFDEFDDIDGGQGTDRLAIAVKGLADEIPSFVTVENVEDVVFSLAKDAILDVDITDFDGVEHVRVTGDRSGDVSLVSAASGSVTVGDFDDDRGVGGSVSVTDLTAEDFSLAAEGSVGLMGSDMNTVNVMAGEEAYIVGMSANSVTVEAMGYVDVSLYGSAGSIDAESTNSGVEISVNDSVTSVDVDAFDEGLVVVGGNAGTIEVTAGTDAVVDVLGSVASVTVSAGGAAGVFIGSDAGTVDVTAYSFIGGYIAGNVDDLSLTTTGGFNQINYDVFGDATLVDVDGADDVTMTIGGSVSDAEVNAGETASMSIGGDVTDELDVVAGEDAYVGISGSAESVSIDAGTQDDGGVAILYVTDDLTTATLTSSNDIFVDVGGDIDTVTATTYDADGWYQEVGIYAGGDIGVANVVAEEVDIVANSVSDANITLGHTDGDTYADILTSGGGIGSVDVDVVESVNYAAVNLSAGEDLGAPLRVTDTNDVGPVDIDLAGNTDLDLDIEAQNSINGDVSVSWTTDTGVDTSADINLHSNSADALSLSLSAESDSTVSVDISVSGTNSDGESMASPESLALSVGGSDAYFDIDINDSYEGGMFEGVTQSLSTVSLTGDADATVDLESISNTLEQFNGGQATGNLDVYAYVEHGSDGDAPIEQVGIVTGSGSDAVYVDGEDAGSGEYHSNLLINTQDGNDYVTNTTDGAFAYVGDIDVNLGDGDDAAAIVTSDATVAIEGGAGSDDIEVTAHVSGGEWTGEITLDIDAGTGDDRVDVRAVDAAREGSTIDLGTDGENTLAYRYTPNDGGTWSDADTEAFDITMGGNVTGAVHTLELHTDIAVSSDVTLDIAGLGPVSVLRTQTIEYASDSQGALLTIEGGASDFLVTAGNNSPFPDGNVGGSYDDIGAYSSIWYRLNGDIQHLSTPGVVNLTVEAADNVGVALDGANNSDMESITVRAEDYVDVALTGFSDGFDVDAHAVDDDVTVALIGGGHYGSVVAAADEDIGVVISGYDDEAGYGTEGVAYTTSVESIRVDVTDGNYGGQVRIDGADNDSQSGKGVGHVTIGSITIEADIDSLVEIQDFSDGSTVNIGSILIGNSDGEGGYDSSSLDYDDTGSLRIQDNEGAAIEIGSVTVDFVGSDQAGTDSTFVIDLDNNDDSSVTIGSIDVSYDHINTGYTDPDHDVELSINSNDATATGADTSVDIGSVDIGVVGRNSDIRVDINNNEDDWSGGMFEISVGETNLTASDDVLFEIRGNDGESDNIDGRAEIEAAGLQVAVGDLTINAGGAVTDAQPVLVGLDIYNNEAVHVQMASVDINVSNSAGNYGTDAVAFVTDSVVSNTESVVTRGDTTITIDSGLTDGGTSYTEWDLNIADNDGSWVELGDYSVTLNAASDEAAQADWDLDIEDNDSTEVVIGDVSLTANVSDTYDSGMVSATVFGGVDMDVDIDGNSDAGITLGNVSMAMVTEFDAAYGDATFDVDSNDDSTIEVGAVSMTGFDNTELVIDLNDSTTVTISDVTMSGIAKVLMNANSDSTINVGNITSVGTSDDAPSNAWHGFEVTDNLNTTVTVSDVSLTGNVGTDAYFGFYANSDTTLEMGTLDLEAGDDNDLWFWIDNNTAGANTVSMSDVTLTAGDDITARITDNTNADIDIGDMTLTAGGGVSLWFDGNSDTTIDVGNITATASDGAAEIDAYGMRGTTVTTGDVTLMAGSDASISIVDNSDSTVTMGEVDLTAGAGSDAAVAIEGNSGAAVTVTMAGVTMDASDDATFAVTDNDGISVTALDVDMSADDDASFQIYSNDSDSVISIGNITIEASDDVDVDITGEDVDVSVGNLTISGLTDGATGVDVYATDVDGLGSISVSGDGFGFVTVNLDSSTDDYIETTVIDMGGISSSDGTVVVDLDDGRISDDQTITFGDFGTATVNTLIDDGATDGGIQGVTQTYVFEGSDIGDITIDGFVAGDGGSRNDVTTSDEVYNTDRLDLSAFITDTDQLNFEFSDAEDSVIITAKNGEFDGEIVVTGVGVDDDASTDQDIIDRVIDSIITG